MCLPLNLIYYKSHSKIKCVQTCTVHINTFAPVCTYGTFISCLLWSASFVFWLLSNYVQHHIYSHSIEVPLCRKLNVASAYIIFIIFKPNSRNTLCFQSFTIVFKTALLNDRLYFISIVFSEWFATCYI